MRSRLAYVILAHKNPEQVARLMSRLATDRSRFLVHVDRRAGDAERTLRREVASLPCVAYLERRRCYWGGFGIVSAALDAMERLVDGDSAFDHVVLLSGQDYPLRPAAEIEAFLGEHPDRAFMTAEPLPNSWPGGGLPRVERWHLVSPVVLHLRLPWRRRLPGGLAPYGGGAWMSLPRRVVEFVVELVRRDGAVLRFFEHALHPDELFFQTIVMNSPLASVVVDDHLRYIDWSTHPGPTTLTEPDLPEVLGSGKLFARKFDVTVDATILDLIDRHLDEKTVAPAR